MKYIANRIYFAVLFTVFSLCSIAQTNRLHTTQQGLATSNINSLYIDSHRLTWLAGVGSLGYYDGVSFHYLPLTNHETGQPYFQRVMQIKQIDDTHYWLLTNEGLYEFDLFHLHFNRVLLSEKEDIVHGFSTKKMIEVPGKPNMFIISTEGYGIYYFDGQQKKALKEESLKLQKVVEDGFIVTVATDCSGDIWASTISRQLIRIDAKTLTVKPYNVTDEAKEFLKHATVYNILDVKTRRSIYMATDRGILMYDEKDNQLKLLPGSVGKNFQNLLHTSNGQLLAGTDGLGIFTISTDNSIVPFDLSDDLFDLSLGKVRDMVEDDEGNLVFALLQKGLFVMPHHKKDFRYHAISLTGNGRNTSCITDIAVDSHQNYWIATDGAGVFTTKGLKINSAYPINDGLNSLLVQTIVIDNNSRTWIGSYGGGVQVWDGSRFETPEWCRELSGAQVMKMTHDIHNDIIYAATNGRGVYTINIKTQTCERLNYGENQSSWVSDVYFDDDQILWISEIGQVNGWSKNGKRITIPRDIVSTTPNCVTTAFKGNDKRVLVGTSDGLVIYNPNDGSYTRQLNGRNIQSFVIQNDEAWIASKNSIFVMNPKTYHTDVYTSFGGFFLGEFHNRTATDNKAGNLLFGCDNGILCCTPKAIREPQILKGELIFNNVRIAGHPINYSDSTSYLDSHILYATQINLSHKENTFWVSFCVPNLCTPQQIHYEYMLEGYDKDWVPCELTNIAYYTAIQPGNYTLRVKASIEGEENTVIERSIKVHVDVPWYDTNLAHLIYLLLICLGCYVLYNYYVSRQKQKKELGAALQNEEIKEAKLRMFTSIAHELRSPLTMIISPLQKLITNCKEPDTLKTLRIMQHNSNRLLDIVQQITDIRKIDAGQFKLHFMETDYCQYIAHIGEAFVGATQAKNITLTIENSSSNIFVWIDPTHFEKVITNLLSNAVKFTPEGGKILVRNRVFGNKLEISVYNSGSHIDEEDMRHIYERFYQPDNKSGNYVGSGIGLNLAYELTLLHHGALSARNTEPDGVEFTITLLLGKDHLSSEEASTMTTEKVAVQTTTTPAPIEAPETSTASPEPVQVAARDQEDGTKTVLIVDDDNSICEYLQSELEKDYETIIAHSGNEAWDIVLRHRPDVILTDMMMTDGDGISLIRRVKSNHELDHTPIIMLTGEGNEHIHMESVQLNVEHYLQKPFNIVILKGLIRQVLRVRENLKQHIKRNEVSSDFESIKMESADDLLFERINESIMSHLDNSEFGVQELSEDVGISRVHLNRKMKEKYGISPNIFIRTYRLKQAAYLLVHNKVNVSEVAYRVGFSTHSYFSSSFRDFFGMTPKEFVSCHAEGTNDEALKKLLE